MSGMTEEQTQICGSSKPGPKPDRYRAMMRKMMADNMSDRTFDTFWTAFCTIKEFDGDDALQAALKAITRPNGSLNVSKLRRLADSAIMRAVMAERTREAERHD